jgi:HEAT repeat protein
MQPLTKDQDVSRRILDVAIRAETELNRAGRVAAALLIGTDSSKDEILWAVRNAPADVRVKALGLLSFVDVGLLSVVSVEILRSDSSPILRHEAAYFLGTIRSDEAFNALALALQGDSDDLVRHEAAEALGEHRNADARRVLCGALKDPSARVRETVSIALQQIERFLG